MRIALALLVVPLLAGPARAADEPKPPGALAVGAKLGLVLPQVATELGTSFGGELEGQVRLPLFSGHFGVYAALGYTQPRVARSAQMDPRLPGAYEGTQTQRELTLGAGAVVRFLPPWRPWNGYASLGLRAYFLETVTEGSAAMQEFGENAEQSTRLGMVVAVGGERRLFSGALLAELQYGASDLPHLITGDVSTGALVLALGYRLFF